MKYLLRKSMISMDIGTYETKIIVAKQQKKHIVVENVYKIPTPSGACEDGYLKDKEILEKGINDFLYKQKIKATQAICTIQSTATITRELILPFVKSSDELASMVRLEIEQYLPIQLEDYVVEHKVLEEFVEEGIKKLRIVVVALPKKIVEEYLQFIYNLNLKPVALDIHNNAVSKVFDQEVKINEENYSLDKTVVTIDMGYANINISIIDRGILRFSRIISQGGKDIDINIANVFNLSVEDAENKKIEHGNLKLSLNKTSPSVMMNELIQATVDNWLQEIQRIFQYYTSRNTIYRIDEIYLYGGSSKIPYLPEYMMNTLQIPTFLLDNISHIKCPEGIILRDYLNVAAAMIRK
ncbi:type IV pilus assembly protein PilM [Clostridiaceae bacterium 35-E11]